jgi:hypothetical protein
MILKIVQEVDYGSKIQTSWSIASGDGLDVNRCPSYSRSQEVNWPYGINEDRLYWVPLKRALSKSLVLPFMCQFRLPGTVHTIPGSREPCFFFITNRQPVTTAFNGTLLVITENKNLLLHVRGMRPPHLSYENTGCNKERKPIGLGHYTLLLFKSGPCPLGHNMRYRPMAPSKILSLIGLLLLHIYQHLLGDLLI